MAIVRKAAHVAPKPPWPRPVPKARPKIFIPEILRPFCVPLAKLTLWEENPRENEQAAKDLTVLIRKYGFRVPIIVDKDYRIIAGHTRYKSAVLLGMEFIPALQQEFVAEGEAEAFAVSDNKAGEFASWDDEKLARLLKKSAFRGYQGELGFATQEIRALLHEPDLEKLESITGVNSKVKAKIIVIVVDAAQREGIAGMLRQWAEENRIEMEVK